MLNQITLMGRLTRDPERRYLENGTPTASFTLAVERDYAAKGEEKKADFINIVTWNKTAEFVNEYFSKGQLVAVEGRLQIRDWVDRDGGKHRRSEVVADRVYFADRKQKDDTGTGSQQPYTSAIPNDGYSDLYDDDESDLPF